MSPQNQHKPKHTDPPKPITIVNAGYRSTNYWIISRGKSRLLIDFGWPGTMALMQTNLNRMDIAIQEIHYGIATHYHIDHAGLAEEFKRAGVPLLVVDVQATAIPIMKTSTKPGDDYVEINMGNNVTISLAESRSILEQIGIPGEILHTPGHSDDSISLLLDDGSAFTGDLTHPTLVNPEEDHVLLESWRLLQSHGAVRVYPGHGSIWQMDNNLFAG